MLDKISLRCTFANISCKTPEGGMSVSPEQTDVSLGCIITKLHCYGCALFALKSKMLNLHGCFIAVTGI